MVFKKTYDFYEFNSFGDGTLGHPVWAYGGTIQSAVSLTATVGLCPLLLCAGQQDDALLWLPKLCCKTKNAEKHPVRRLFNQVKCYSLMRATYHLR